MDATTTVCDSSRCSGVMSAPMLATAVRAFPGSVNTAPKISDGFSNISKAKATSEVASSNSAISSASKKFFSLA